MRFWGIVLWGALVVGSVWGSGMSEDYSEVQTKTWDLPALTSLEVRGEVDLTLTVGPKTRITVETTRALFDQLNISEWFGAGTVAIETGLRGPRETGPVKVTMEVAGLESLSIQGRSRARVTWPSPRGRLTVGEESAATVSLAAREFTVETSWLTGVTLTGSVGSLRAVLRHQAKVDTRNLSVGEAFVLLDEKSTYSAGPTAKGSATVRHLSEVRLPEGDERSASAGVPTVSAWTLSTPDAEPQP